jgi:hypothetical protein
MTETPARQALLRRCSGNGWLIFYGHDVAERPSPYGCAPALLNHALETAARRKIPALTMAEAMRCARA